VEVIPVPLRGAMLNLLRLPYFPLNPDQNSRFRAAVVTPLF
jgi:hypothetical protein